ncbi:MAG TPA: hypothetical protein VMS21_03060, partial [Methylomirabilota bacterium]|nr:hypothetical protein [Methylomirabilota bacterium]
MRISADTEQLAEALPAFAAVALWGESAQLRRECLDAVLAILDSHAVTRLIDGPVPPDKSNPSPAHESFRQHFHVGLAAWLVWDQLPLEVRARIASLLIHHAGIARETLSDHIQISPRTRPSPDWTGSFLVLAGNLFPSHPQADVWTDTAAAAVSSGPYYQTETHEPLVVVGIHETTVTPNVHAPTEADSTPAIQPSLFHGLQPGIFQLLAHLIGNHAPPGPLTRDTSATARLLLFFTLPDGRLFDPTHTGMDAFSRPSLLQVLGGLLVNHPDAGLEAMEERWLNGG